jgi:alanyl-tRNA synthetase
VTPSNVDQGYVLRRLIRRATRFGTMDLGIPEDNLAEIAGVICEKYQNVYPELGKRRDFIREQLSLEITRFFGTVHQGMREFEKLMARLVRLDGQIKAICQALLDQNNYALPDLIRQAESTVRPLSCAPKVAEALLSPTLTPQMFGDLKKLYWNIDGVTAFHLYDTFGFPIELTREMAKEQGIDVDMGAFNQEFEEHKKRSQGGMEQRFKGGLADASDANAKLHTATHLLLASLRKVLGDDLYQKGSNITPERLRFDFNFPRKLTPEELTEIENLVNDAIKRDMHIACTEMTVDEAHNSSAIGVFGDRYGERVRVYTMGDYSREICGGPHASRTGELGTFKIQKEESSSSGVRRIRAVLK